MLIKLQTIRIALLEKIFQCAFESKMETGGKVAATVACGKTVACLAIQPPPH